MKITFELKDEQTVIVKCNGKETGQIFSAGGTGRSHTNTIQVCGFTKALEHWGCGVYADSKGKMKQDIELMFNDNIYEDNGKHQDRTNVRKQDFGSDCIKCYNQVGTLEKLAGDIKILEKQGKRIVSGESEYYNTDERKIEGLVNLQSNALAKVKEYHPCTCNELKVHNGFDLDKELMVKHMYWRGNKKFENIDPDYKGKEDKNVLVRMIKEKSGDEF